MTTRPTQQKKMMAKAVISKAKGVASKVKSGVNKVEKVMAKVASIPSRMKYGKAKTNKALKSVGY